MGTQSSDGLLWLDLTIGCQHSSTGYGHQSNIYHFRCLNCFCTVDSLYVRLRHASVHQESSWNVNWMMKGQPWQVGWHLPPENHFFLKYHFLSLENLCECFTHCQLILSLENLCAYLNPISSSWHSDAIWHCWAGPTWDRVMVCCLMAPSHCMNYVLNRYVAAKGIVTVKMKGVFMKFI